MSLSLKQLKQQCLAVKNNLQIQTNFSRYSNCKLTMQNISRSYLCKCK